MSESASKSSIFAVRTTNGREIDVAMIVERRVIEKLEKGEETTVKSILVAPEVKGFVFIEASNIEEIYALTSNIKYVKASRPLKVSIEEVFKMLKPRFEIEELNIGDEVEIVRGPFRGMRAKVISIDKAKNTITVNLLEAAFSIPVTIQASYVKRVRR